MLIHETAGITDTECRIQLNINSPIGENLKILGGEYSVFLKKEEDGIYMKSFIETSFATVWRYEKSIFILPFERNG